MLRVNKFSIIILSFLALGDNCYAQWIESNNGLFRGSPNSLLSDGTNLFVGTFGGGVFMSNNDGENWNDISSNLGDLDVSKLAISGSNLFAGTYGGGMFLSTNNGISWTSINNGLTATNVLSILISGGKVFAGTNSGLFMSSNNGSSWTAANTGLTNTYVWSLTADGSNLFAGTDGGGVFLSTNSGANWTAVNTGLTSQRISHLYSSAGTIFAGAYYNGLFRSTNNGANWTAVNTGLPSVSDVTATQALGAYIFAGVYGAGVYRSSDGGASWVAVNTGLSNQDITSFGYKGTKLFVSALKGVYATTNDGAGWSAKRNGLLQSVSTFAFGVNGGLLNIFAGTTNGVFSSSNQGQDWNNTSNGLTNKDVRTIISKGNNLFAGTFGGGIFTSTISSGNWSPSNGGLGNLNVQCLANSGGTIFAGTDNGPFISSNDGATWSSANSGLLNSVTCFAFKGTTVYAGTASSGIFISTNNGTTWQALDNGPGSSIRSIALIGDQVFAATTNGVLTSNDGVTDWHAANIGLGNLDVHQIVADGYNLFASTAGGGVFLSTDNAGTWSDININLAILDIRALAISGNVASGGKLFAGTYGNAAYSRPIADFKQGQRVTLSSISTKVMGNTKFLLTAVATSGLTLAFTSINDKVSILNGEVTLLKPGRATINADQPGDANFYAAPRVTQTFCINPAKPTITISVPDINALTLTSSSSAGNQWYRNGTLIPGATDQSLSVTDNSKDVSYTTIITIDGCISATSDPQISVITSVENSKKHLGFYPNPVDQEFSIHLYNFQIGELVEISVLDLSGRKHMSEYGVGGAELLIEAGGLTRGFYLLKAAQGTTTEFYRFIKK